MLVSHNHIVDREHKFGTVHFDFIDNNRLVNYQRTAFLVFNIEIWFSSGGYSFRRGFMIPENSKYAMEHYKSLLTDDITLSFNEALFLLLGLDVLTLALSQFSNMDLINYKKSLNSNNMVEDIFINTAEFNELIHSDLTNNRIKSGKLFKLGEKYGFFSKLNNQKKIVNILEEIKPSNKYTRKSQTIESQKLITGKAKELLNNNFELRKTYLAEDISAWLEETHGISLNPKNIERDYLTNFKELKQRAKNNE